MPQEIRVAFRADASQAMGTGHVRRCLALAQALKGVGASSVFVCRRHDDISVHALPGDQPHVWLTQPARRDHSTKLFDKVDGVHAEYSEWGAVDWQQDADETIAALAPLFSPLHWLVVDHYAWDSRWHQRVSKALGCRLMVIDDLANRLLVADLLLDQNLHANHLVKYASCVAPDQLKTRFVFGPRFALLSARYAEAPKYVFSEEVKSIGIFMGGTDPDDISSQALQACRDVAKFEGDVVVVSSTASPHHAQRRALAAKWPRTTVISDLPDLADFFASHDLQIGAGGGAAWERCSLGAPTLAFAIAANQDAVLPQLAVQGAVQLVEASPGDSPAQVLGEHIGRLVSSPALRLNLSRMSSQLVDGVGARRVAAVMAMAIQPDLTLHRAKLDDELLLLNWSNEAQTRSNAFNPQPISAHTHADWLRSKLSKPDACVLMIAQASNGMPVGTIRFDHETATRANASARAWRISYSLDHAFRGMGLGRVMVRMGLGEMRKIALASDMVSADVKVDNIASIKIFSSLLFTQAEFSHNGVKAWNFQKPLGTS
jgi:UDP-2,4-diacetamido-2,4,6-trideoxy-beta-L-altropyranose hydrolase